MTKYDGTTPGLSTRCVHAGEKRDAQGAIHPALYNHSTFGFENTADLLDVVEGRTEGNLYTRYGLNPTIRSLERKLADLENGEAALAFGSGMAAEAATFFAHAKADDHIVCIGDVYGGTYELLSANLPEVGIETTFLLADEVGELPSALTERTRIVFFETPTNPALDVIDVRAVAEVARAAGALTVVDNTFATPVNQNPLDLGANLVVHSATKYLGGHSDLTGGVVIGNAELLAPISMWRKNLGQMIAPEVAFLLARSIRTLVVRVRAQNATAQAVAEFLGGHPRVARVNYPGSEGRPSRPRGGPQADARLRGDAQLRLRRRRPADRRGGGQTQGLQHRGQPGWRREPRHPTYHDHPPRHDPRGARLARHSGRHGADLLRPRRRRRPHIRSGTGTARRRW